ncbi:MAG: hypothetical protein HWE34_13940 [Methylocystaceae bacterium]|nr:hypothetical protein [Methylocystaceae bacterium]
MTHSFIIEEEGNGKMEIFPLDSREENLLEIFTDVFENYWDQVVFGPLVQGAVFEIHAPNAPTRITMLDGYLTVNFGSWHFHLCIGKHKGNRFFPISPKLAHHRRCQRAEMYRYLNSDGTPRSWGMRFYNGNDEQMITVFFPNPFISDEEKVLKIPDWSRLAMWNEFRQKYLGLEPDPLDQSGVKFRCGGH